MHRPTARHYLIDSDAILLELSQRQYLRPHQPVGEALDQLGEELGLCQEAIARAVQWLEVKRENRIGRYRRSELSQLAKSIHRYWRHIAAPDSQPVSPASD